MSRRDQIRMTDDEVAAFLDQARTIVLCSNDPEGHPHPMPMWFVRRDDGTIDMTTFAKSHKVANLRDDPRVSLLVEDGESYEQLRGAVLYGRVQITPDDDDVAATMADVAARYAGGDAAAMVDALRPQAAKRVRLRVVPDRIVSWDHRKLGGVY